VYKWFERTPDVNVKEVVERINVQEEDYIIQTDTFGIKARYGTLYAVMGNVAYEVTRKYNREFSGYIHFPNGSLMFEPGRERLTNNDSNDKLLNEAIDRVKNALRAEIDSKIDKLPDHYSKCKFADSITNSAIGRSLNLSYPKCVMPRAKTEFMVFDQRRSYSYYSNSVTKYMSKEVDFDKSRKNVIFDHQPRMQARLKRYAEDNGVRVFSMTPEQRAETMVDSQPVLDPNTTPKIERESNGSSVRSEARRGRVWESNVRSNYDSGTWDDTDYDALPDGNLYYYKIVRWEPETDTASTYSIVKIAKFLKGLGIDVPDVVYGIKPASMSTKWFKEDPSWVPLETHILALLKKHSDKLKKFNEPECSDILDKIAEFHTEGMFGEWKKLQSQVNSEISDIAERFGIDIAKSNDMMDLSAKILDTYPGLEYWITWIPISGRSKVISILKKLEGKVDVADANA
jgi:hypothetical protein